MSSIKRPAHCLRREKTLAMPREVIFFDTETVQYSESDLSIRQELEMGWLCVYRRRYGRHRESEAWTSFFDTDTFWRTVLNAVVAKTRIWVIAHNLNFDFTVVKGWKYLRAAGYRLKFFHNSGTCCIISVYKKGSSIIFVDFMNWFPESLDKIGRRIGMPKIVIDLQNCGFYEKLTYCRRDVEILLFAFKDFVSFLTSRNISRLCYTRASTSMAAYMLNHYDHKIYIHNNREAIQLERQSYRGGRTEAFRLGVIPDGDFYIVDVNSLYPYVMACNPYPVKYSKISQKLNPIQLQSALRSKSVIAKVRVSTEEAAYAVKADRTIFPVGSFWVTLCTPELKYALEHGHIEEIRDAVIYEQAPIFTRYVERFYKLRQEFKKDGKKSYEQFCKQFLNSLYGKFGQKAEVWTKIGKAPNEPDHTEIVVYPDTNRRGMIMYLMGEIFELTGFEEAFNSFPAIASHVTAYGRMYLYELMKLAGDGNYFYSDTDSLIVNEVGLCRLNNLVNETDLGYLKVQEKTTSLTIKGLKDYVTDSKAVVKGIRKNAVYVKEGMYEQERWPSLKGMLRAGRTEDYIVHKQTKVLTREYSKGQVLSNGVIVPIRLGVDD